MIQKMSRKPYRFISFSYRLICFLLIILPTVGVCGITWNWSKNLISKSADRELVHAARCILDVVRMRYDLVHNYLYQDEQYLRENMTSTGNVLHRLARELELEVARRHISESRAQDILLSLIDDLNERSVFEITVLNQKDRVLLHSMLPDRFDMSQYRWIQQMRKQDSGTLRYNWQYPGESNQIERLAVFRLLEGWRWMLTLESELPDPKDSKFGDQQLQGLNDFITGYHAPSSGYAMILSIDDQTIISHPEFSEGSIEGLPGADEILSQKSGNVTYMDDDGYRWRVGMVSFVPRRWVVAVTAREDLILKDAQDLFLKLLGVSAVGVLIISLVFFRLMRSMMFAALSDTRRTNMLIKK